MTKAMKMMSMIVRKKIKAMLRINQMKKRIIRI